MQYMSPRLAAPDKDVHWSRTRCLTLLLLVLWSCLTLTVIFYARTLSQIVIFGWPVSFYMAAQGCVLGYVLLTGFYAWAMERLDTAAVSRGEDDANGK